MTQLLARLLLPLPLALGLLTVALGLLALARRRAAGACLLAALTGLWMASARPLVARVARTLERANEVEPLTRLPPADALLLLGGATKPALSPRAFPELNEAGDRVLHAARLFHAGKAPLIVASGGRQAWQREGAPEAVALAELLGLLGVPEDAILLEPASTNTRENCTNAKRILDERGARDVLLVTSALHMRRALATCRGAGVAVRPSATDYWVAGGEAPRAIDWAPDPEALLVSHLVLHELLGFEVYRFRGWIHD